MTCLSPPIPLLPFAPPDEEGVQVDGVVLSAAPPVCASSATLEGCVPVMAVMSPTSCVTSLFHASPSPGAPTIGNNWATSLLNVLCWDDVNMVSLVIAVIMFARSVEVVG